MIIAAQPTEEEKEVLLEHYIKAGNAKAHAVLLSFQGQSAFQISQVLFRTEKTVREWIKHFGRERMASIFTRSQGNQNAAKLTREQKQQLAAVLAKPPSDYGIPARFWSIRPLKHYVLAQWGVEYGSDESYRLIFKLVNYSFKLPAKFNIRRDEAAIAARMAQIIREIKPRMKDKAWEVLAGDETRAVWETLLRRAWLPKGAKTVIKTSMTKSGQSFFGALNLKSGREHTWAIPWQNQTQIIRVLKKLKRAYPGKRICLIWDNAKWHKGKILKKNLGEGKPLSGIYLINLYPYAPDTNPQEKVWKYGKDQIANQTYQSLKILAREFLRVVTGRPYPYRITQFDLG